MENRLFDAFPIDSSQSEDKSFANKKPHFIKATEPIHQLVPEAGLEPARPHQTLDFESNASTDSTIRAWAFALRQKRVEL